MTSRERVRLALDHQPSDRIPLDVGGTDVTGIHVSTYGRLRALLGIPGGPPKAYDTFQMLAEVEPPVRAALGGDVVGLSLPVTVFGYRNEAWKPFLMPDGTEVLVSGHFEFDVSPDGSLVQYPQGDKSCPPSGKMARDGFYFDLIARQPQFREEDLNARQWVEETYSLRTQEELRYLEEASRFLVETTEYAVVADLNPGGFAGVVPILAPHVKRPTGIRDLEEFWMSYVSRKAFIQELFHHQFELQMKNLRMYREALDDRIDVIIMSKTDFGAQNGPLIPPQIYRELFKPLHTEMNAWVHRNTAWKTFFHTCGDNTAFLDDFIEAGLDVLNPVQISAGQMEPGRLKEQYGERLVFWGGGISTQTTLPFGTPEQVQAEVEKTIQAFAPNGGFMFCPDHNIQPKVPIENIRTMYDTFERNRERIPVRAGGDDGFVRKGRTLEGLLVDFGGGSR